MRRRKMPAEEPFHGGLTTILGEMYNAAGVSSLRVHMVRCFTCQHNPICCEVFGERNGLEERTALDLVKMFFIGACLVCPRRLLRSSSPEFIERQKTGTSNTLTIATMTANGTPPLRNRRSDTVPDHHQRVHRRRDSVMKAADEASDDHRELIKRLQGPWRWPCATGAISTAVAVLR